MKNTAALTIAYKDVQLLEMLQSNQKLVYNKALRHLYRQNYDLMVAYVRSQKAIGYPPQELLQDTLIIFWDAVRANKFRKEAAISTYLHKVAKRLWINRYKKQEKRQEQTLESWQGHDFFEKNELDRILAYEQEKYVSKVLSKSFPDAKLGQSRLKNNCKQLLVHRFFNRLTHQEIAEELALKNANTAKASLYKCLQKLRKFFEDKPRWKRFFR